MLQLASGLKRVNDIWNRPELHPHSAAHPLQTCSHMSKKKVCFISHWDFEVICYNYYERPYSIATVSKIVLKIFVDCIMLFSVTKI